MVIGVGGVRLARDQRVERIEGDRADLNRFVDDLQDELERLESRYVDHLGHLVNASGSTSALEFADQAEAIWGVRQFSMLEREGRALYHRLIEKSTNPQFIPVPLFKDEPRPINRDVWVLDRELVGVGFSGASGWLTVPESGKQDALLFWKNPFGAADGLVAVVTIDSEQVAERIDAWLVEWLADASKGLQSSAWPALRLGRANELLVVGNIPNATADQVRSLRTRFGEWQVQSWDERRTMVSFDERMIKASMALASLVVVAGVFVFFKLRQTLRLAAQRVSFVNRVSHELRTPLTNILLNVDLAAENASPTGKRRLGLVRDEAGRLQRLIDNVLSFSARRQRMNPAEVIGAERCEVRQVIDELLSQFSTALGRKGIEIKAEVESNAWAMAPADAVAQIVGNLISNVEKYAADGGLLIVKARSEAGEIIVRVIDRGPGIARSQRERIFEAFQRLNDRVTEGSSGTGLGLSIARDLAEEFAGSLRMVESDVDGGAGAAFELRLPLADEPITVIDFPTTQAS